MARPKKPGDPAAWPNPCARCNQHYQLVARWPDGRICGYCYQAAKRERGTCRCGHTGVLPGRIDGHPACRSCSGVRLNIDCVSCGAEAELYRAGRCLHCELNLVVDNLLTDPGTGKIAPELVAISEAMKNMKRANSGLTWIKQGHVREFFEQLRGHSVVTHELLDTLPPSRTRDYVRGLLVEHGAIPRNDLYRDRFNEWTPRAIDRLDHSDDRDVITRFIRWHILRRMNEEGATSRGTFLRSKQTVTVAIDFLSWLRARGVLLENLGQSDLDEWQASGPTTRGIASRFLGWAIKSRLVHPDLRLTPHRRGTSPKLDAQAQTQAIDEHVHSARMPVRHRAIAILLLVFGQPLERLLALTWDDVTIADDLVTIRLGGTADIELPSPIDEPFRQLAAEPDNHQTAAHPDSNWVFPGYSPGRHLDPGYIAGRLRTTVGARAARLGTLHELTKLGPTAIIAEFLGYSPATIELHARGSAANYASYIKARLDDARG
ncbi:Fis family transcriptional regulator [Janibacter anophelis]|uniref:Fis family transcriptional regulator n=1 Tax=Janibacter anophelis TaxID=319054 RepID=UPI0008304D78|nr:Fis family transcriptional regulator [Janibacter anophelis]